MLEQELKTNSRAILQTKLWKDRQIEFVNKDVDPRKELYSTIQYPRQSGNSLLCPFANPFNETLHPIPRKPRGNYRAIQMKQACFHTARVKLKRTSDHRERLLTTIHRKGWSAGWPNLEVSETEKEPHIPAEMPGLDEKDVEVSLDDGMLTLRGEKKAETEVKSRHVSERFYGRFERQIALGPEVEQDKVVATFNNGVLTVTLPKSERAQSKTRRIAISTTK